MRSFAITSIACLAATASAFQYPDFVPLHRRQEPGTPAYECHANCGGVISASREDGYCDSSDFESKLSACLDCALEYDIWKYYGNSVSNAATGCGLDATPVDSSSTTSASSTTTEAEPSVTSTSTTTTTTSAPDDTPEETTSSAVETTTESVPSSSGHVSTHDSAPTVTASPTTSRSVIPGTSTPSPSSPVFDGGASSTTPGGLFLGVMLGSVVAAFM